MILWEKKNDDVKKDRKETAYSSFLPPSLPLSLSSFPNRFLGQILSSQPEYLILELADRGNLYDYLKKSRTTPSLALSLDMQIGFAVQIAQGMAELEKAKIVHRDLAA